jgi:hypothetical protein
MSIQQYSVEVQCDYCDEVIRLSGKRRDDSNVSILRNKIERMGWKTTNVRVEGKLKTMDFCPFCLTEHSMV